MKVSNFIHFFFYRKWVRFWDLTLYLKASLQVLMSLMFLTWPFELWRCVLYECFLFLFFCNFPASVNESYVSIIWELIFFFWKLWELEADVSSGLVQDRPWICYWSFWLPLFVCSISLVEPWVCLPLKPFSILLEPHGTVLLLLLLQLIGFSRFQFPLVGFVLTNVHGFT